METIISGVVGAVIGVAACNLVTGVASGTGTVLRGVAKEVIKGGIVIQEAASDFFSGTGTYVSDLVTEARNELAAAAAEETLRAKAS